MTVSRQLQEVARQAGDELFGVFDKVFDLGDDDAAEAVLGLVEHGQQRRQERQREAEQAQRQARIEKLQAAIAEAQAELDAATTELRRIQRLVEKRADALAVARGELVVARGTRKRHHKRRFELLRELQAAEAADGLVG